jgi:hypothetical protein
VTAARSLISSVMLPLLREMAWVYRSTLAGHALDPQRFVLTAGDAAQIMRWLFPLQQRRFATLGQFRHYARLVAA